MDLDLSDDQVALRDGIASLLSGHFGSDRVRAGFDRAMHEELAGAGVFSLRDDGFSWADCVVVFEQLGRWCVPGPLVGTLLAADADASIDPPARGVYRRIGGAVAGVVERAEPAWVEHLDVLDALLVLDGDGVWRVDPAALEADPSSWPLDPCTPVARVASLPHGERTSHEPEQLRRAGAVLTAALALGLADRLTEMSVAYAKERMQFDRPIGSFQAVKHILADMLTRTELARAAVYAAGAHLDAPDLAELDRTVSTAKVIAGETAIANGKAATQVHGGMGFTWEVDVHLYLKRAWVLDTHFGSIDAHCDALASQLM